MKQTHPKKANIIAGLLSLCLTLFCPMAKAEKAIYTLQGRTLIINEGVTEINEKDFPSETTREITKVELPTSLQKIGNSTFAFCTSLKSINLPPSLTEIGDSAFYYCRNLKKIEIPNAVSRIGTHAFACCEGINQVIYYDHGRKCYGWVGKEESCPQKIVIAKGVTAIDDGAFDRHCSAKHIVLPEGLKSIGSNVFSNSLEEINIPNSVDHIGDYAFHYCWRLKKIEISNTVSEIGIKAFDDCKINQVIYYDHGRKCYGWVGEAKSCPKKIVIAEGVISIDDDAFSEHCSAEQIVLPEGLKSIGNHAFPYDLKEINIPNSVDHIGDNAINSKTKIDKKSQLLVYANGTQCYGWMGDKDSCPKELVIPKGVTHIKEEAFKEEFFERFNIIKILLPEGLKSIGDRTFPSSLEEINIPNSVDHIGDDVFGYKTKIDQKSKLLLYANNTKCYGWVGDKDSCPKELVIPEGVTYINKEAFLDNPNITKMVFPESLRKINESVLAKCDNLETVVLSTKLDTIESYAFEDCDNLENINIPSNCEIREGAFQSCGSLNFLLVSDHGTVCRGWTNNTYSGRVEIPQGVKIIAPNAFYNCNIGEISLPEGLDSIGTEAFSYCHNLEEIRLPNSVRHIGKEGIFKGCDHLKRVHLSDSLPFIPASMFSGCTELESIEIPNSVTYIGYNAFAGCSKLKSVRLPEGISMIVHGTFSDCVSLKEVHWPSSLKEIESQAFENCPKRLKREIPKHVKVHRDAFETSLATNILENSGTITFFSFCLAVAVLLVYLFHSHKKYSWMKSIVIVLFIALGIVLLLFLGILALFASFGGYHG